MRLMLIGPPGCGKGTQADLLSHRLGLAYIGTGDLLREAVRDQTPTGERARVHVESGRLVPDEVVNDLVADRFRRHDRPDRFVLDGYPRTLEQAQTLDPLLREQKVELTGVVLLRVPDEEIVQRLKGRRSCPKSGCQRTYHTESNPPRVPGVCDQCGTALVQRADDLEETVRRRLVVYHENTEPLAAYYRAQGLLREVDARGAIEDIYRNMIAVLGTQAGRGVLKFFSPNKPELKSAREIGLMREAGKLVAEALRLCREMAKPGARTLEIDQAVDALYARHGATPLFKGYKGGSKVPFPAATCISVNEQVVHGIPGQRTVREGDLLKIDTARKLNGWCADAAITVPVGAISAEKRRLLDVAWQVLRMAMVELGRRKWWSEVAREMQRTAESAGFSVVTQYVGHGIGRIMHEHPQVPNFVNKDVKKHDFRLDEGLVLAVEPMVNMGRADTDVLRDHWTVVTRDGLPSAHVEHTLALTKEGVYVVTADSDAETLVPRSG